MRKPRISVVVPNLNEEKYLPMFLRSLEHQTFKAFEVIIVDGGSKDRSQEIIHSWTNKLRIILVEDKIRNFGVIRNKGASFASSPIIFQGNSDTYLEPLFLEKLYTLFDEHPETLAIAGRVYPLGTSIISKIAYPAFDLFRFLFTCWPVPIRKFRPSGSFTAYRKWIGESVGGYPEVAVNEDGMFGQRLDLFAAKCHKAVMYRLNLWVGHHVKKFEKMGGPQAFLFYLYTLGNFAPILKPLLAPIENRASLVYQGKPLQRINWKRWLKRFWDWL